VACVGVTSFILDKARLRGNVSATFQVALTLLLCTLVVSWRFCRTALVFDNCILEPVKRTEALLRDAGRPDLADKARELASTRTFPSFSPLAETRR
jgi:hypothetical protein